MSKKKAEHRQGSQSVTQFKSAHPCGHGLETIALRPWVHSLEAIALKLYYHRRDLEYPFFRPDFEKFCNKFSDISAFFSHVYEISPFWQNSSQNLFYSVKFRRNLVKFWWKFAKICFLSSNSAKKYIKCCKMGAKVPKNERNLEWCRGKNVELEKRWKMRPWSQKSALIQPRTSLGKV